MTYKCICYRRWYCRYNFMTMLTRAVVFPPAKMVAVTELAEYALVHDLLLEYQADASALATDIGLCP